MIGTTTGNRPARAGPDTAKGQDEANQDINISITIKGNQNLDFNCTQTISLLFIPGIKAQIDNIFSLSMSLSG